jgi:hypothetical protein
MNTEESLRSIQAEMTSPDWMAVLTEFEKLLANTPKYDIERECDNIGHCLMLTLKSMAPDMPEATQYSLPYAFTRLLRDQMRINKA